MLVAIYESKSRRNPENFNEMSRTYVMYTKSEHNSSTVKERTYWAKRPRQVEGWLQILKL
jgi:hypothetical protein